MLQRLITAMPEHQSQSLALEVRNIAKRFGNAIAVQDVSIAIEPGEIAALLGPSGCGKTTVLRMIAGLQEPDTGDILIGGQRINSVPVWERNIGMVFQNYALFPHMTVAENVGFGLRVRSVAAAERKPAVMSALDMVRLGAVAERLPSQLSGGQRQRVALARALVTNPRLLLLDEPLGALDRKLREQMQLELKLLQRRIGITTVMVTHDQEEALTLSDRIIVMNAGRVVQVGTPEAIYRRPGTGFIADFIGTSNFFSGVIVALDDGIAKVRVTESLVFDLPRPADGGGLGTKIAFFIRPENLFLTTAAADEASSLPGRVLHVAYSGAVSHCYVDIGLPQPVVVLLTNNIRDVATSPPASGDEVRVAWARGGLTALAGCAPDHF